MSKSHDELKARDGSDIHFLRTNEARRIFIGDSVIAIETKKAYLFTAAGHITLGRTNTIHNYEHLTGGVDK